MESKMFSNIVIGGGIAGLTWALYHPEYRVLTDKMAWAVLGSTPSVVLYETPETIQWIKDVLPGRKIEAQELRIGYLFDDGIVRGDYSLTRKDRLILFQKKMRPWSDIVECGYDLYGVVPERFGQRTERALAIDAKDVVDATANIVLARDQVHVGARVTDIYEGTLRIAGVGGTDFISFEHLVSTIPAPIFQRLWRGPSLEWRLESDIVTLAVTESRPSWLEGWHFVYDARPSSCVSRIVQVGALTQYEITGRAGHYVQALEPLVDLFYYPFGRIRAGVVKSPSRHIDFLGRFATWDYRVLTDDVLKRVTRGGRVTA